ncbi:MAG: N-acyl-D-amino-acid deacylase family protein [Rhabdaerophilum sp.]
MLDGTGSAGVAADIAIRSGRIVAVGAVSGSARQEIVAEGLVVSPGFIDVHTHDDRLPLVDPGMEAKASQGVTTVIAGNCGISAAPTPLRLAPPPPLTLLSSERGGFFRDFRGFRTALEAANPALNMVLLAGHSALRAAAMEDLSRPASPSEIRKMIGMLEEAIDAGASGLSTGLYYPPSQAAPSSEVEGLLEVVSARGGIQTTHLRDEGDGLIAALDEALASARSTGTPLVISHLKCASPKVWGRARAALERIEAARAHQPVAFDVYPYDASSTMLRADRLKGARKIVVSWSDPYPEKAGQDLAEVAECWCCSPEEAAGRLSPAGGIYYKMEERDVRTILAHPSAMIGSDGLPHDRHPHPRLWGTFPRVLGHYVRDLKLMTLESAVHRMTGLPARVFGLTDRGLIAEGYAADITIFDPALIIDRANFDEPLRPARGIERVIVNGAVIRESGKATGMRPGRILTREGMKIRAARTVPAQ